MVKIVEKSIGEVTICVIEGKLSGFEGKGQIQDKIRDLMNREANKIVLDLTKVNWIDSTGLGELIASLSSVKKTDGGNMVLSNLQAPVQSLLKMTNLTEIFEVYDSYEDAVKALEK